MPLFMAQFAYTPQAWTALIHAPQDRAAASSRRSSVVPRRSRREPGRGPGALFASAPTSARRPSDVAGARGCYLQCLR